VRGAGGYLKTVTVPVQHRQLMQRRKVCRRSVTDGYRE
jgi:hypothetical protein